MAESGWAATTTTPATFGMGRGVDRSDTCPDLCCHIRAAPMGAKLANLVGCGLISGDWVTGRRVLVSRGLILTVAARSFGESGGGNYCGFIWVVALAVSRVWVHARGGGADRVYGFVGVGVWGVAWADAQCVGGGGVAFGGEFDCDNEDASYLTRKSLFCGAVFAPKWRESK